VAVADEVAAETLNQARGERVKSDEDKRMAAAAHAAAKAGAYTRPLFGFK
jgi:hypothetical protein